MIWPSPSSLVPVPSLAEGSDVVVSVGGPEVANATVFVDSWKPDRVVFGEWGGSSNNKSLTLCPMLWYGGTLHETTAKSILQMTSDLKSLAMLHSKTTVTRPA